MQKASLQKVRKNLILVAGSLSGGENNPNFGNVGVKNSAKGLELLSYVATITTTDCTLHIYI